MSERHQFSLAIIARNCAEILDRCLSSAALMEPDEIVVVNTGLVPSEDGFAETSEVAKKHGAKVYFFPWNGSFSDARNFSFEKCSHEIVMWLDSDDEVIHPERLARNIRQLPDTKANAIMVDYLYEWAGEPGKSSCTTQLSRERVVLKSQFEWRSPIHEVICCKHAFLPAKMPRDAGHVVHHQVRGEDVSSKLDRNIAVFNEHWPDGKCERRMLFYWGNTLTGLERRAEADDKWKEYLGAAGVDGRERLVVLCSLSESARIQGRYDEALSGAQKAIHAGIEFPGPWNQAAESCFAMGRLEEAAKYATEAVNRRGRVGEEMVSNPAAMSSRPHFILAFVAMEGGDSDTALQEVDLAIKEYPEDEHAHRLKKNIVAVAEKAGAAAAFVKVCDILGQVEPDLAANVASAAPPVFRSDWGLQKHWVVQHDDKKKRLAIMCGPQGIKGFDHTSLEKGISGSEEAVAHVAKCFVKMGWEVDVYNDRDAPIMDGDSIRYLPFPTWRSDAPYHTVMYWRIPHGARQFAHESANKVLWLHDVVPPETQPYGYWEDYNRVFLLSPYHGEVCFLDGTADHKVFPTQNGIQVATFPDPDDLENDLDRVIWPSDPGRALDDLVSIWPALKEKRPDLSIDVFYGFTAMYDEHMQAQSRQGNDRMKRVKDIVMEFAERDDVRWHGMKPQEEVHQAFSKAGWWLYPTTWPEIHCISALKAQALGCIGICVDDFALKTTAKHCIRVPGNKGVGDPERAAYIERFRDQVIETMKLADGKKYGRELTGNMQKMRQEGIEWARSNTWERVTREWADLFLELKPLQVELAS